MWRSTILGLILAIAARPSTAQDPGLVHLERELARIATLTDGKVGVAALHLQTGRGAYLNADEPFPMASTYKVPIAVELLTRVERGAIRLDTLVELKPWDLHPGSGTLTELFDDPGVILSLRNLLELMLLISDNSATDIVLRLAGGPEAVTSRMRQLGIDGIRVDRPTIRLIADWIGIDKLPPESEWTPSLFGELARGVPDSVRAQAARRFDQDLRDTATPRAMSSLLAKVWRREALKDSTTELLLDIMRRSTTGAGRIKGMLPPDIMVSHKTGTIGGTTNDVGILTLPDGAGNVALSVFIKGSTLSVEQRERVIAHIARAVYDYFRFNPGS